MRRGWWILKFIVIGTVAVLVFGLVIQTLWNWLVPALFAGPVITFWQGLGLLILSKIIFSGFGKGGGHWRYRRGPWGSYWNQKWHQMTTEEKEQFKQKMWSKWCPEEKTTPPAESGVSNG